MALKITGLGDAIEGIIRKQSEAIVKARAPRIKDGLLIAMGNWRDIVRSKLNVLAPKPWDASTPRNLNPWPKRRTGKLYFSILKPKVKWKVRTSKFKSKYGKASLMFSITDFYGSVARDGYGETLNHMKDTDPSGTALGVKPFAGWKTRANAFLFELIKERTRR